MPKTTKEEFLSRAAEVAFAGVERETDISHFSRPRQVFITIYSTQPIIDNGGFVYFFEKDWPGRPPYSRFSAAYREIGAVDVAGWIDRAASLFGITDPHLRRDVRLQYLKDHCHDESAELIKLGDQVIDESRRVFRLLEKYARLHTDDFRGPKHR